MHLNIDSSYDSDYTGSYDWYIILKKALHILVYSVSTKILNIWNLWLHANPQIIEDIQNTLERLAETTESVSAKRDLAQKGADFRRVAIILTTYHDIYVLDVKPPLKIIT